MLGRAGGSWNDGEVTGRRIVNHVLWVVYSQTSAVIYGESKKMEGEERKTKRREGREKAKTGMRMIDGLYITAATKVKGGSLWWEE